MLSRKPYRLLCSLFFLVGVVDPALARLPDNLDALLVQPPIIGVAPGARAWNADGSALAFAWNDRGGATRDLWLHIPGEGDARRLTQLSEGETGGAGVTELDWIDARRIALVIDGALWSYDLGSAQLRELESRIAQLRNLQVSPDGRRLAFTSGGPATRYQHAFMGDGSLWLRDTDAPAGSPSVQLHGNADPKVAVERYEWSGDGSRIALLEADNSPVREREIHYHLDGELKVDRVARAFPGEPVTRRRLGVLDVTGGGEPRWLQLDDPEYPVWDFGLSADGSQLFTLTSDSLVKHPKVYVHTVDSGDREVFYQRQDPGNVVPGWRAAWAPDDEGLIILTDRDGYYHLYHVPEAGAEPRAITAGEWEIWSFDVDSANGLLYFVANRDHTAERHLYRVPVSGGEVERLTSAAGHWDPQFAGDFSRVALTYSSDTLPPDLYALLLSGASEAARITHSPTPAFDEYTWAEADYIAYPSDRDGQSVLGRLQVPPDFDPQGCYPLIVGSIYSDTVVNQWARLTRRPNWALDQYLVSQGYLVLKVNVRGSRGQGRVFSGGLFHDYGGIDIDDIETVVRGLIADGTVDADRVGIWGNSYGGLMTVMSLFRKPGLYAAGIAGAPATNVAHAYPSQMWVMGEPAGDDFPARYERQSPLFQSAGLADPLMIIHGTTDPIVLYSDTLALLERLIAQNKTAELVTLPGGSHGWMADSPAQTRFAYSRMLDFFTRHLPPGQVEGACEASPGASHDG
ncbi:prolyl oligopeptidase family serine peptidase [Chromatocurvus halotolerans]|uniref:Dipeptidyl-peptidase-4 n=1 Tax=Chromatocurvus halotolerans TaxID=1132028 RepID=A0A4R2LCG5_9GAMM|nr:prolyl oligopeptidase family serine peptidase [Chromatocurvus halotolerans]TCO77015.1 dipeptidyl-peptidase-4 [Chromatocurvus halotolerans]